jgi:eukaryotic-like serine/threonine-protein kinase
MPLTSGSRLGPYEIVSPIGAGGMGEVYKAKDTRLDRTVALKVISPLVAGAPELRERFEREARAVSQLNHPHICTLHDVGMEQGTEYLVLEYLDGESLAGRLSRGALPLEQATTVAIQICDALDKAHRAGIVHRDLKPGNVFLVRGATASAPPVAKLLDFGLAKSASGGVAATSGGLNLTSAPTVSTPLTAQGTILGTFQYMAPEQLEGDEADARTDIWAFGCVLYEMLTGKEAFAGRTHAGLISSIMSAQPTPVAEAVPQAPPVLDHVVRTCLAKDPAERFQTAHDLLLQLRWIAVGSAVGQPAVAVSTRRRARPRIALAAALAGVAAASALATWLLTRPAPRAPLPATRALVDLPPKMGVGVFGTSNLALSPDGSRLVFVGASEGGVNLYVRDLERFEPASVLSGTADAIMPFFSADGASLGFFAGGKLKRMSLAGGAPSVICDMAAPMGAVWAPDDTIVFSDLGKAVLMRVPAAGGVPTAVTALENGETAHRWPTVLPDGSIVFSANRSANWSDSQLVVQPAGGGARRTILEGGTSPRYVHSGHLTFVRNGELLVVAFDARALRIVGQPRQIGQSISMNEFDGRAQVAIAASGTIAYVVSPPGSVARSLVWVSRDGTTQPLPVEPRAYEHPRISPDGRRVALAVREDNTDVWVIDVDRKTLSRFTFDPGEDESPVWTPDGKRLTYAGSRTGKPRVTFWKAADSSGVEEALFVSKTHQHISGWTPDGKTLISEEIDGTFGLYVGSLGDQNVKPYLQTAFIEVGAQLSPDGKWIAYTSNESGPPQVFVQAFPGPGSRIQISTAGGSEPRWAPSGRELFYRNGDRMMAVPIDYTPTLRPGAPAALFEGQYTRIGWGSANYDVTPDGRRFLMVKGEDQALPTQIRLVVNPVDELRRLAPHK